MNTTGALLPFVGDSKSRKAGKQREGAQEKREEGRGACTCVSAQLHGVVVVVVVVVVVGELGEWGLERLVACRYFCDRSDGGINAAVGGACACKGWTSRRRVQGQGLRCTV